MGRGRDGVAGTGAGGLENRTSGAGCGGVEDTKTDTENLPEVFQGGKNVRNAVGCETGDGWMESAGKIGTENLTEGL